LKKLSRRDFGKKASAGALGGLAVTSLAPLAAGQGEAVSSKGLPKPMTTALREMIAGPGIIDFPGIYDPLTAKIAESVGFRCVNLSSGARGIVTCQMEAALSLDNLAEATRNITSVINIPLLVDAGGGFGEPAHVFHAVRVLEHAGAAGICIEDRIYPQRFHSNMDGRVETIPAQEMVEKIRYAVQARRDPDLVIGASTEAIKTEGFFEGARRANLYLETGADYVLLFPRTAEETRQMPREVRGPLSYANAEQGAPERPNFTAQELGAMGWKMLTHPSGAILLYYKTLRDALARLKETGSLGLEPAVYGPAYQDAYQMIGINTYYVIEYWTSRLGSRGAPGTFDPAFQPK